jgi:hypothetical protein
MDCTYFFPPALIHFFEEKARFVNALRITFAVLSPRACARDSGSGAGDALKLETRIVKQHSSSLIQDIFTPAGSSTWCRAGWVLVWGRMVFLG